MSICKYPSTTYMRTHQNSCDMSRILAKYVFYFCVFFERKINKKIQGGGKFFDQIKKDLIGSKYYVYLKVLFVLPKPIWDYYYLT